MESTQTRSDHEVEQLAGLLTALGHPVRLRIVEGLLTGECCVGSMVECLALPQPLVSRHLSVLREAGVVAVERVGRKRSYSVVHPGAIALLQCIDCLTEPNQADRANATEEQPS